MSAARTAALRTLSAMYDRTRFPAPGMLGGSDGAAGSVGTASGETSTPNASNASPAGSAWS